MQWFPFSQGSAKSLDTISMPRCGLYNVQGAVEDSVCQGAFSVERACGPRARSIPRNTLPRPSRPPSLRESVTDADWARPCHRLEVKRSSRHVRRSRRRQRIRGTGTWKGAGAGRQAQHLFVDASHLPAIERKQLLLLLLQRLGEGVPQDPRGGELSPYHPLHSFGPILVRPADVVRRLPSSFLMLRLTRPPSG